MDDVNSVLAELEAKSGAPAGASEPAAPVTTQPPAKVEPPPVEKPVEAKPSEPPAAPPASKVEYTVEELDAFEGNYDRRDFDWERVPQALVPYAKRLASGTGKYRSRLRDEVRAELETEFAARPSTTPAKPTTATPPTAEQVATSIEKFLNPETAFEGLGELLSAPQGKEMLARLGYADPAERAVVSDLVEQRTIERAIVNISEDFPQFTADAEFQREVTAEIGQTPLLLSKVKSRDEQEVTMAFAVGSAIVASRRIAGREQAITTRETALKGRETALAAKEAELQRQIEATNRKEPASPTVTPQTSGNGKATPSVYDDARDAMRQAGMQV